MLQGIYEIISEIYFRMEACGHQKKTEMSNIADC